METSNREAYYQNYNAEDYAKFSYSELIMDARMNALDSYRDAHGESEIIGMTDGDLVDFMNSLGEIWDCNGMLSE